MHHPLVTATCWPWPAVPPACAPDTHRAALHPIASPGQLSSGSCRPPTLHPSPGRPFPHSRSPFWNAVSLSLGSGCLWLCCVIPHQPISAQRSTTACLHERYINNSTCHIVLPVDRVMAMQESQFHTWVIQRDQGRWLRAQGLALPFNHSSRLGQLRGCRPQFSSLGGLQKFSHLKCGVATL